MKLHPINYPADSCFISDFLRMLRNKRKLFGFYLDSRSQVAGYDPIEYICSRISALLKLAATASILSGFFSKN